MFTCAQGCPGNLPHPRFCEHDANWQSQVLHFVQIIYHSNSILQHPAAQTTNPHLSIFLSASASEQLPLTAVIANTSTAPLINFFKTISPTFDFFFDGPPSRLRKWFRFGFQLQPNDTYVDFWSAQQPFENLSNDARGLLQQIYKLLMGFLSFKH